MVYRAYAVESMMFSTGMVFALLEDLLCCDSLAVQAVSSPNEVSVNETLCLSAVCIEDNC